MIIRHDFPNIIWLKKQIDRRFNSTLNTSSTASMGWPTVLLNVKSQANYRGDIKGPFSLFYNIQGQSKVSVDNRTVALRPGFFFLTNASQAYDLEIPTSAETFNIHFGEQFLEEILESHRFPNELEQDWRIKARPYHVYNRLYPQSPPLQKLILAIHQREREDFVDPLWLEEKLYAILCIILTISHKDFTSIERLPAMKTSSREEIFRRLSLAVDLIYAQFDQSLSLEDLAQCSFFSKFHFLRLFKVVFGYSPHQFITQVRIQKAKEWLQHTDWPIHLIANGIGLENTSSFSRLFYQKTGMYPTPFRMMARK
ncbi:MAG: helix-turn-helix transcriptional regulator [Saprospiraceae bacterium]|nr:helix-turn-helix transcriptional regulator [Saprospiraceae bacterium]